MEKKYFDLLEPSVKASIMAYLCDELLTTTNYDLDEELTLASVNGANSGVNGNISAFVNGNSNNNVNGAVNGYVECSNQEGVIVKDLEQTIDELNQVIFKKCI